MSDTLQDEVAFEVAIKIVHKFEAIQIHQHQREGPASTRRTLPLRGKRFHKEAMRFHAGQAIGDRLLLRFLESQRVMQRACNQIGQSAKQKNFFVGEIDVLRGFHVQHAVQLFSEEDRQAYGRSGVGHHRLHCGVGSLGCME